MGSLGLSPVESRTWYSDDKSPGRESRIRCNQPSSWRALWRVHFSLFPRSRHLGKLKADCEAERSPDSPGGGLEGWPWPLTTHTSPTSGGELLMQLFLDCRAGKETRGLCMSCFLKPVSFWPSCQACPRESTLGFHKFTERCQRPFISKPIKIKLMAPIKMMVFLSDNSFRAGWGHEHYG